eukprot:310055-Pyramimonas_sp.AAC.1
MPESQARPAWMGRRRDGGPARKEPRRGGEDRGVGSQQVVAVRGAKGANKQTLEDLVVVLAKLALMDEA